MSWLITFLVLIVCGLGACLIVMLIDILPIPFGLAIIYSPLLVPMIWLCHLIISERLKIGVAP